MKLGKIHDVAQRKTSFFLFGVPVCSKEVLSEYGGHSGMWGKCPCRVRWKFCGIPYTKVYRTECLEWLLKETEQIARKVSLENNIVYTRDAAFYVPNYPYDFLQNTIVSEQDFHARTELDNLAKYISSNATILDIGANIGNHTVYFGKICRVKKIYSFEPVAATYAILLKNIELNHLRDVVSTFNLGLGNRNGSAYLCSSMPESIGSQSINYVANGDSGSGLVLRRLDDIEAITKESKINFIKIDVEGFELEVLKGAERTIAKHLPVVFVESFDDKADDVKEFFARLGYSPAINYPQSNYLFLPVMNQPR
jgi:FkbM family methyltransferase